MIPSHGTIHRRQFLRTAAGALGACGLAGWAAEAGAPGGTGWNVRGFGAVGDGSTLNTSALQKAIDACARAGGGNVILPAGRYLSGTLVLRDGVTLHLESGAVLLGSTRLEDYPSHIPAVRSYTDNYTERSLIYAENVSGAGLTGHGTIDGQGAGFKGPYKVRPYLVRMIGCTRVKVADLTILNSPMWVQHYLACDNVLIDGITVVSRCNANNDGIDIDGCSQVRIANCDIQSGDDAIVLKSTLARPCKNVVVTNCVLSSDCNGFKLGTESNGGFEDIVFSNSTVYDTRLAGIALEIVDGGRLERVGVSNISMSNVRGPIFIRLGNRARPFSADAEKPGQGSLRGVMISHVQADGADRIGCAICGLPGARLRDITLSNIRLGFAGGGKPGDAADPVPERAEAYPEFSMFGKLPAYGFYCRHAENLVLENIEVRAQEPEERPALVCDDVAGLRVRGCNFRSGSGASPVIRLSETTDVTVADCVLAQGAAQQGPFLKVAGKATSRVRADSRTIPKGLEIGPEVDSGAVTKS